MSYKTTDALMRHLRNHGISISGSTQKQQLITTGYYHGYKGYRFFKESNNKIPYRDFSDVYETIKYDTKIKSLCYDKIMFIETAVKNVSLERIMIDANSESIQKMYDAVISRYNNLHPNANEDEKRNAQKNKLRLENLIQSNLSKAYSHNNPKITHFYNNMSYSEVPLWALFEILTLGDFAYLLSCLTIDTRDHITSDLGMQVVSIDTNRELIYKYLYTLKDFRNAVAHNSVVFDARFCNINPTRAMKRCLENEFSLPYINFKTIGDYIILICYYLKLLKVSKTEIKAFIRGFETITNDYKSAVDSNVASIVVHPDLQTRLNLVKQAL